MVYDASLGYDDGMPDAFTEWMTKLDTDVLLDIVTKLHPKIEDELWEYFANKIYPYMNEPMEE